jgi:hypothetical protein
MIFKAICFSLRSKQPQLKYTQMLTATLRIFYPDNYRDCKNHKPKPSAVCRVHLWIAALFKEFNFTMFNPQHEAKKNLNGLKLSCSRLELQCA